MSLIYHGTKAIIKQVDICKINNQEIELGRGGQAIVYKAVLVIQQSDRCEKKIEIALKRIKLPKQKLINDRIYELIKREQSVYRSVKSPHIIKLYGTNLNYKNQKLDDLENLDFYFELCDGSLADLIMDPETRTDLPVNEDMALNIFQQVVEVELLLEKSQFFRSTGIKEGLFHRDMNIKNILFKKKKNKIDVKVCDFGMANYILEGIFVTLNVGTNSFQSPENKFSEQYNQEKNEVWSLGILLFCLLKGYNYYKQNSDRFNNKNDHHALIQKLELQFYTKELLINLLQTEPSKRWGYDEIKQSKWFQLFSSQKIKYLETIGPLLKFRQKCFNELSLQLIEYENFINQNNPLLQEYQIPQDLLQITLKSYQLWTWKQLEKYSGSYCYEHHCLEQIYEYNDQQQQLQNNEANLINITQELRDFFLQIDKNNLEDQQFKNFEMKQIIQYWSQIKKQTTNIAHFRPDALYYQINLLEQIQLKLLSLLSIFTQTVETQKINNKISKLKELLEKFQNLLQEQQQKLENLKDKEQTQQQKQSDQSGQQQQKDQISSPNIQLLKEEIEDLKYQIDACSIEIKQKEYTLQILEQKEKLQKTSEYLQKIKDCFKRFFNWKRQEEYNLFFKDPNEND
ncbi:unnamed protein product [Paramecium primaurelia]|uniref:Protein kinase domain-containing protein n=1 Tax=Paramecium primaurelia TaxID=5886 RepID=A0A8S1PJE2_PARPR|nr:unnamed protein product [Paramecium primaurelia]